MSKRQQRREWELAKNLEHWHHTGQHAHPTGPGAGCPALIMLSAMFAGGVSLVGCGVLAALGI